MGADGTTVEVTGVSIGSTSVQVTATDRGGLQATDTFTVTVGDPLVLDALPAPENLKVAAEWGRIVTTWDPVPEAASYELRHRMDQPDTEFGPPVSVHGTRHVMEDIPPDTTYVVRVRAVAGHRRSEEVEDQDTTPTVPPSPQDLRATASLATWRAIDLSFIDVSGQAALSQYRARALTGGTSLGPWAPLVGAAAGGGRVRGRTAADLLPGTVYEIEVRVCPEPTASDRCSAPSEPALGSTQAASATSAKAGNATLDSLQFEWTIQSNRSHHAHAGYDIGYSTDTEASAPETLVASGTVPFTADETTISGLSPATHYRLFVRSFTAYQGVRHYESEWRSATARTKDVADRRLDLLVTPAAIPENGGVATVTATLSHPSDAPTTVTVSAAAEPAAAGVFRMGGNRLLTIPAGEIESTGEVTITAIDNAVDAPDRTVRVSATVDDEDLPAPDEQLLTIEDDDDPSTLLTLTATPDSVVEGDTEEITLTATLDGAARTEATTVTLMLGGTATNGLDFDEVRPGTLTIPAEQTSGAIRFTLATISDGVAEGAETVTVEGIARDLDVRSATITIEPAPHISPRTLTFGMAGFGRAIASGAVEAIHRRIQWGDSGSTASSGSLGGQSGFGQPGFGQPGFGQPGFGQPGFGQPGFGQPGFGQPGFGAGPASAYGFGGQAAFAGNPGGLGQMPASLDPHEHTLRNPLTGSHFEAVFGQLPEDEPTSGPQALWAVWGSTEFSQYYGNDGGASVDGEVLSTWFGLDYRRGQRFQAGVAGSHALGEISLQDAGGLAGEINPTMTSVLPWARWSFSPKLTVWGLAGLGSGTMGQLGSFEAETTANIGLRLFSAGVRSELTSWGPVNLALRGDSFNVTVTGDSHADAPAPEATARRTRVGLENRIERGLDNGVRIGWTFEGAFRHDSGDADNGLGVEVGSSLEIDTSGGFGVLGRGRYLAAHQALDFQEKGVSVELHYEPGGNSNGFTFGFRPSWGLARSEISQMWQEEQLRWTNSSLGGRPGFAADASPRWGPSEFDMRAGYGMHVDFMGFSDALLMPFGEIRSSANQYQSLRFGVRLADMAGAHDMHAGGGARVELFGGLDTGGEESRPRVELRMTLPL